MDDENMIGVSDKASRSEQWQETRAHELVVWSMFKAAMLS